MAANRFAAFISYAHRHRPWVEVLRTNLERCLDHAGRPGKVFLDTVDLGSGRSWVGQLQAGLDGADSLILIAAPESLASPRVTDEWETFYARRREWRRGLHVVKLVETPIPPFLDVVQHVDFIDHDETKYRDGLTRLLAGLLGRDDNRTPPELAPAIDIPQRPSSRLPADLRTELVQWMAPVLEKKSGRHTVEAALDMPAKGLDHHPSEACAASAALVHATGKDDPIEAALRVVRLLETELDEDMLDRMPLDPIRERLQQVRKTVQGGGLLGTFLSRVAHDHESLVPYFQSTALDRVYVKLQLRPEMTARTSEAGEKFRFDAALDIEEVLALDPAEHSWVTRRWVVRGDPGAGKTTLLRHLACTLARRSERGWVPVFESLPQLMRQREFLLDRIERRLERSGEPAQSLRGVLDAAGRDGRLLLLLDGLDEVPREDREDTEALLRDLATRWPQTPIVVSTRPIGYRRPDGAFRELDLQPLDKPRRIQFLGRWLGRDEGVEDVAGARRAVKMLEDDAGLWKLSGNPLYLTLIALLIEEDRTPERNRTRLYDQVFDLLLEGKYRPEPHPIDARAHARKALRHLAHAMTLDNRDSEPIGELEARLYGEECDDLRKPLERVPRWRRSMRPFLEDVAQHTGILGPHDGPDADWRYWHRTFREALAAEALQEEYDEHGYDGIRAHLERIAGDESRWAEPYALLAGRVPEPDLLVRQLVKENHALGYRALATAQGLRDDTLTELLELSDNWEQRSEVYGRIPELVGESERALRLRIGQTKRRFAGTSHKSAIW